MTARPGPRAHHTLRDAPGAPLVLMSDFAAAGRPTGQFPELVPLLQTPATYWETAPPGQQERVGMNGEQYGQRWLADVIDDGRPVAGVLGFCSGAVFAGWLADRIGRLQQQPPVVVLLDPEPATKAMVLDDFVKLVTARMADLIPPEQSRATLETARRADQESGDDAMALFEVLAGLCQDVIRPGFVRLGQRSHRSDEFVELFVGYLQWLAAACSVSDYRGWGGATVVLSSTPELGLQATPPQVRSTIVAEVVDVDVPHFDLLRSAPAAAEVDRRLTAGLERVAGAPAGAAGHRG